MCTGYGHNIICYINQHKDKIDEDDIKNIRKTLEDEE